VGYHLSVEKSTDLLSIKFQPVDPLSRRQHLLVSFGIEAVFILMAVFLWSHWWARIFFPAAAVYGIWGSYRQLGESEEVTLSKDNFRIAKFRHERRFSIAQCKPWFLTNVRFKKRGHNRPSSITCEVEARFSRFAEGISESDAYSIFSALLDSGFLPRDSEIHFP
jgi:uncharacterized membrane protein